MRRRMSLEERVRRRMNPVEIPDPENPGQKMVHMDRVPRPNRYSTWILLAGLLVTWVLLGGKQPTDVARVAALGVGISLGLSIFFDSRVSLTNVIRPDIAALLALYFLTLFEFLFPQPDFNALASLRGTTLACSACLCGFAGLAIGRHFVSRRNRAFSELFSRPVSNKVILGIFWTCMVLGYLHMLLAVDFNVFAMVEAFMGPRFSQPWSRGQLGDWKALLNELGLLLYLIPPISGIIFARRHEYAVTNVLLVGGSLLFTMFYAFSSGTRNIFASYLVTFAIGYAFAARRQQKKELLILVSSAGLLLIVSTVAMLQFRTLGLRAYLEGAQETQTANRKAIFVDYNLFVISHLVLIFPNHQDYLGWEVPYQALIRPIPRALWKDKPQGLSTSIEDVLGFQGLTLAASFVGEAYMAGGFIAVFAVGAVFGCITSWWSKLASPRNSQLGILIYASGFFAAVISMRSLFVFTTAILPTVGATLGATMVVRKVRKRRAEIRELQARKLHRGRPA